MLDAWRSHVAAMGLPITSVSESHAFGWSFAAFDRVLREPATPAAKAWPWVHRQVWDRVVIVRPSHFYERTTDSLWERALLPPAGSGLERYAPPAPLQTIAMAEIDPPIFAGLQLVTKPSARFGHPDPRRLAPISRSDLAPNVWVTAHDVARVNQLFSLGVPAPLLQPMVGSRGIALHDGVVEVFVCGIPSAAELRALAERAALLGSELSMLSQALPLRLADAPVAEEWARAAAARGLAFDAKRWRVHGACDGLTIDARLETGHGALATSVHAKLRWPLGCGLALRKALVTERPHLFQRAPGDVFVGEKAFDAEFVIDAVHVDAARERLSQHGVTDALRALAAGATQVLVDDANVFVSEDGCSGGARLAQRLDAALAAAAALTPQPAGGAYR